jgi:predicted amidophosphoribosyltransferase
VGLVGELVDLVLPGVCAGCGAERVPMRFGVCGACAAELEALVPFGTAPTPAPPGMPACVAVGGYGGALRGSLLAYKERKRHRLAKPLGHLLAAAIVEAALGATPFPRAAFESGPSPRAAFEGGPSQSGPSRSAPFNGAAFEGAAFEGAAVGEVGSGGRGRGGVPIVVVPVPSTGRAARERNGDHMRRLAGVAVRRLRLEGWDAEVVQPLRALPKVDSASLDVAGRAREAENSLRIRGSWQSFLRRRPTIKGTLIVVDDIVTTGATLAAVTGRLREVNMQVTGAAVLAATRRRAFSASGVRQRPPAPHPGSKVPHTGSSTRGDGEPSAG